MTAHAEHHAPESPHLTGSSDPRLALAAALKFEPSELHDFEAADKAAGQMMGKLLGLLFCILLFLMTGVNIWMMSNSSTIHDTDPQAFINSDSGEQHAAPQH
ncbi:hypothetical protein [Schlesneria sp.]|uniref:hypothetical protein n=1 Tax=Schlesneria sp. TaxID=2762018 RepID=UPI002EE2AF93